MNYELANYIVLSINTFMCLSSPVNLLIYCGMSKQFRDEIRQILARFYKRHLCFMAPSGALGEGNFRPSVTVISCLEHSILILA